MLAGLLRNTIAIAVTGVLFIGPGGPGAAFAQPMPPLLSPPALDRLVQRVALYPDSLLVQVLTAATYPDQVPDAARWSNEHTYLHGDAIAAAMQSGQLPWDPSVQALLPFPQVLDMMARDMGWTTSLGNAFLVQRNEVMDAVQRMRRLAYNYGYLRTRGDYYVGYDPNYIEIRPLRAGYYYAPVYDPYVVYAPPRPGYGVALAIGLGAAIIIGAAFAPWGWGHSRFGWSNHAVYVNERPWGRTWANRASYSHSYGVAGRWEGGRRVSGAGFEHRPLAGEHGVPGHVSGQQQHVGAQQQHVGSGQAHISSGQSGHVGAQQTHVGSQQTHVGGPQTHVGSQPQHVVNGSSAGHVGGGAPPPHINGSQQHNPPPPGHTGGQAAAAHSAPVQHSAPPSHTNGGGGGDHHGKK